MNCYQARRSISPFLDGCLPEGEMREVAAHFAHCTDCRYRKEQTLEIRNSMRHLPPVKPPENLTVRLQVVASRERARQYSTRDWRASWNTWAIDFRLWADNLMRPLALPFAGGLVSAVVLFSMLVSPIMMPVYSSSIDVPTALYTAASVKSAAPFFFAGEEEIAVELMVNEHGRIIDYNLPGGNHANEDLKRRIENTLLFTEFKPATAFGQPKAGKLLLLLSSSAIDVQG
jgi:anti-sigma factor RsiW